MPKARPHLFALKGTLLVAFVGDGYIGFARPVGDKLVDEDERAISVGRGESVGPNGDVMDVRGSWPDRVDAVIKAPKRADNSGMEHWRLDAGGWKLLRDFAPVLASLATFGETTVALLSAPDPMYASRPGLVVLRGPPRPFQLTPLKTRECEAFARDVVPREQRDALVPGVQPTDVYPLDVAFSRSGKLWVVETRCSGELAVETWERHAIRSSITVLSRGPASERFFERSLHRQTIAAGPADEGWIFGATSYHFDGASWSPLEGQPAFEYGSVANDGAVWAVGEDGALYRGGTSGFARVSVPDEGRVESLALTDDGVAWILANHILYKTRGPTAEGAQR